MYNSNESPSKTPSESPNENPQQITSLDHGIGGAIGWILLLGCIAVIYNIYDIFFGTPESRNYMPYIVIIIAIIINFRHLFLV